MSSETTQPTWPDGVTPENELVELLTHAQRRIRANRRAGAHASMFETAVNAELYCAYFTAAWYLKALNEIAPQMAAKACAEVAHICDQGDGVAAWTYELLCRLGINPQTIAVAADTNPQPTES